MRTRENEGSETDGGDEWGIGKIHVYIYPGPALLHEYMYLLGHELYRAK